MLLAGVNTWIHWPDHGGYNFVSGPLADITLLTAFASFLWLWWRKHNCHVHRCWRISWHPHPVHGHPVCKKHHPDGHRVTAEGVHAPERGVRPAPDPAAPRQTASSGS